MYTPEQLLATQKEQVDAFIKLSQKSFAQVEKLVEHNLNTIKSTLEESGERLKEAMNVKDVQELASFSSGLLQPTIEKAVAYNRALYQMSTEASTDASKIAEENIAKLNKSVATAVETMSKNAPAGSESIVALMKSSVSAANNAFDSVSKAAKQAAEATEANLNAAANATIKAASAASAAAAKGGKKVA
ncbi:MAG: phasin family protein [Burkholderiales bacterium]|jgi:phasin family protein|nr:phasin family protein [Burkholderiales bacterium]